MDGVLCDFWGTYTRWAVESKDDDRDAQSIILEPRYSQAIIDEFMEEHGLSLPVVRGAKESLGGIQADLAGGVQFHVITARQPHHQEMTKHWLSRNGIRFDTVNCCSTKTAKVLAAISLGIDWMIDDHPDVVTKAAASGIGAILIKTLYNIEVPVPTTVIKAEWDAVPSIITDAKG